MFSVDTLEEAKALVVMACPKTHEGKFYAKELAQEQSQANLISFGEKLALIHEHMKKSGSCECKAKGRRSD